MMKRRTFATGVLALAAVPFVAWAQQPGTLPRVVHLSSLASDDFRVQAFRDGLRDLGHVEGRTITVEYVRAERPDLVPQAVASVLAARPAAIVTLFTPNTLAIKDATQTIPTVFSGVADPIATGIIKSIARPEANLTGVSLMASDMAGKRMQFLKEFVPNLARVAVFYNPDNPGGRPSVEEVMAAGPKLGIEVLVREARGQDDWRELLMRLAADGAQAFILVSETTYTSNAARIATAAMAAKLAAVYDYAEFPQADGLMSYGVNLTSHYRRAAYYVDRILKGAKPSDLPVEQPREFDFVINRKTADALGLKIPEHLLVFATEVIE